MLSLEEETQAQPRSHLRRWVPAVFVVVVIVALVGAGVAGLGAAVERIAPLPSSPPPARVLEIPEPAPQGYVAEAEPLNPFKHSQTGEQLTDHLIRHYMYGMSKQKVIAPYYQVRYGMTQERIDWLMQSVRDRNDLVDGSTYTDILQRWARGDFSGAVEDHNTLYRLMDGEIGKAERAATPEEEAEIVERFYR